jgi:xanthine dehydrogenase YagT iron-sulfur-binding subunit
MRADLVYRGVDVGMTAPDFTLPAADGDGQRITLSDLRGQPVVLAFVAADWDPARAQQLAHVDWIARQLPGVPAKPLAVAMDGIWCHVTFADQSVRVPVLADLDPRGAIAARYGVRGESGVFVIDSTGIIVWCHVGPTSLAPQLDGLLDALGVDGPLPRGRRPTRREFITAAVAAACALAVAPLAARAGTVTDRVEAPAYPNVAASTVTLRVNGQSVKLQLEPRVTLLDALREYAGLTGTKKGCDHGQCGACTVHVNGRRTLSCLTFAVMHQHDDITTVEGLATGGELHPMQAAFITHDGFQCGYCTPGQLMSATAILAEPCGPSDTDVKECMSGNICRCGAYPGIIAAIQDVRATPKG